MHQHCRRSTECSKQDGHVGACNHLLRRVSTGIPEEFVQPTVVQANSNHCSMFYSTLSSKALPPLHYRHTTVTQIPALDVVEISSSSTFNARLICGLIKQLELNWRTRSPPVPKDRFDIPHVCREILESLGDEPNSLDHFGRCSISKVTVVTSIDTVNLYSLVMLGHYTRDGASPPGTFLLAVYVSEEYRGRGLARDALQLSYIVSLPPLHARSTGPATVVTHADMSHVCLCAGSQRKREKLVHTRVCKHRRVRFRSAPAP